MDAAHLESRESRPCLRPRCRSEPWSRGGTELCPEQFLWFWRDQRLRDSGESIEDLLGERTRPRGLAMAPPPSRTYPEAEIVSARAPKPAREGACAPQSKIRSFAAQ